MHGCSIDMAPLFLPLLSTTPHTALHPTHKQACSLCQNSWRVWQVEVQCQSLLLLITIPAKRVWGGETIVLAAYHLWLLLTCMLIVGLELDCHKKVVHLTSKELWQEQKLLLMLHRGHPLIWPRILQCLEVSLWPSAYACTQTCFGPSSLQKWLAAHLPLGREVPACHEAGQHHLQLNSSSSALDWESLYKQCLVSWGHSIAFGLLFLIQDCARGLDRSHC